MAYGKDIADKAPPPDKLPKKGSKPADAEPAEDDDEDTAKAARVSVMQEVIDAFKDGNAEAACEALDRYNDLA
jgi:hypothetical protein